ncbi:MAG TPA: hypothetical protein DEA90_11385 [Opitutae bacterium]|nr:hypothetical protein [Puniceicoccaceae bacterium]HBR94756.1 hypothetical protein [Opitutae bacterium]|tara:strand:+ start:3786 stop:4382 length:597 start_codon:yes stop_codon:yes gene_type:complete
MKKTLSLAMFGLLTGAYSLMGAYQYGDYVNYDYSKLNVIEDSSLTLDFFTESSAAGYVITDWDTLTVEITDGATGAKSLREVAIDGVSIDIGNFVAGQSLFFYVTGSEGTTLTSAAKDLGHRGWEYSSTFNGPESLFFGGNYDTYGSQYTQLAFRVSGGAPSSPATSGQPLPGVAVSMLMGSAGLYWVKRKKSAVVAR